MLATLFVVACNDQSVPPGDALIKDTGDLPLDTSTDWPGVDTAATADRGLGYLQSATTWVDALITESTLAPLNITGNCNLNLFDPVPLNDKSGFANLGCSTCLHNSAETSQQSIVVCSVNDVL